MRKTAIFVSLFLMCQLKIQAKDTSKSNAEFIPVLLVHGIFSQELVWRPLIKSLEEHGLEQVATVNHFSYWGEDDLKEVADYIHKAALELQEKYHVEKIDLVSFSMGALASRYMIQRMGGKKFIRKFVSIAGPQQGTHSAHLVSFLAGMSDMRPGSEFLKDLEKDADPWGVVQVYSFYTPYDLIVLPGSNGILNGSKEVKSFQVTLHHQMLKDKEVIADVMRVLEVTPLKNKGIRFAKE